MSSDERRSNTLPKAVRDHRHPLRNMNPQLIQELEERFSHRLPAGKHHRRTACHASHLGRVLAPKLGFTEVQLDVITSSLVPHDIGKLGDKDWELRGMYLSHGVKYRRWLTLLGNKKHQKEGAEILQQAELGPYENARQCMVWVARFHHYPERFLCKMEFPDPLLLWALRIARVVDAWDGGTIGESERGYQVLVDENGEKLKKPPYEIALELIKDPQRKHHKLVAETFVSECLGYDLDKLRRMNRPRINSFAIKH